MGGIDTGTDEGATDVVTGAQRLADVGAVVGVDVGPAVDGVGTSEVDQAAAQGVVVWTGGVLDTDGGRELVGGLAIADGGHIDRDHLLDTVGKTSRGAVSHFLVGGDVKVRGSSRRGVAVDERFGDTEEDGDAGFVVEVARFDVAVRGDRRAGVETDEVADLDAEGADVGRCADALVEADFDRLVVAFEIDEGLAVDVVGRLGRQDRPGDGVAGGGVDGAVLAFDRRPVETADEGETETAVLLDLLDHRAEGVDVSGEDAAAHRGVGTAREGSDEGTFDGAPELNTEFGQLPLDVRDRIGGEPGWAGDATEIGGRVQHEPPIDRRQ